MKIQDGSGHERELQKHKQVLTTQQRALRGLKASGLFFGLAVASIAIPVFHFVLVPLFLILTIFSAYENFRIAFKSISRVRLAPIAESRYPSQNYFLKRNGRASTVTNAGPS